MKENTTKQILVLADGSRDETLLFILSIYQHMDLTFMVIQHTTHPPLTTLMEMVSSSSHGVASMTSLRTSNL